MHIHSCKIAFIETENLNMTPQMMKKLKKKLSMFENAVRDHDSKGSQPIEYHDSIQDCYDQSKKELIDLIVKYSGERK